MIEVSLEDRIAELDEEISAIEKTLKEKQEVDYTEGDSDKGPCAINVIPK